MNVIVTGAAGFVGGALAARLAAAPLSPDQRLILVDRVASPSLAGAETIVGDIADPLLLADLAGRRPHLVFHMSAIPGGMAETDPALSRRVNLDATLALAEALAAAPRPPRLIHASSIAVFGVPLPPNVDDDTFTRPSMTYGAHKLMAETALADMARRKTLDALALRLPGIVARPAGPSGLKSAFMSDLFHRLRGGVPITLPVSADGHVWIMSLARCIDNLIAGATADLAPLHGRVAITMPALVARVGDLVRAVTERTGADPALVDYAPDPALEAQFAAYPPLATPAAGAIGLRHDGDLAALVARALAPIGGA